VVALALDRTTGVPRELQTVSTLPAGFRGENTCADVQIAPSGRFLYASNRGHDSIITYRIDQRTGLLNPIDHAATQGRTPRNFRLDPTGSWLLVANQDSDSIVTFRIEAVSGKPRPTGQSVHVPTPVCVKFPPPASAISSGGQPWPR
jgi:6-phosphogluconolactonase